MLQLLINAPSITENYGRARDRVWFANRSSSADLRTVEGIDLVLAAELQQGQRRLAASPSPERLVTVGRLRSGVWSRAALLHRQNKKKGMPCLDKSKTYPVSPYLPASTWPAWLSQMG